MMIRDRISLFKSLQEMHGAEAPPVVVNIIQQVVPNPAVRLILNRPALPEMISTPSEDATQRGGNSKMRKRAHITVSFGNYKTSRKLILDRIQFHIGEASKFS